MSAHAGSGSDGSLKDLVSQFEAAAHHFRSEKQQADHEEIEALRQSVKSLTEHNRELQAELKQCRLRQQRRSSKAGPATVKLEAARQDKDHEAQVKQLTSELQAARLEMAAMRADLDAMSETTSKPCADRKTQQMFALNARHRPARRRTRSVGVPQLVQDSASGTIYS